MPTYASTATGMTRFQKLRIIRPPRLLGLTRSREQRLTVWELHEARVPEVDAVLRPGRFRDDGVAILHGVPRPAEAHQSIRAPHLKAPVGRLRGVDLRARPVERLRRGLRVALSARGR